MNIEMRSWELLQQCRYVRREMYKLYEDVRDLELKLEQLDTEKVDLTQLLEEEE